MRPRGLALMKEGLSAPELRAIEALVAGIGVESAATAWVSPAGIVLGTADK